MRLTHLGILTLSLGLLLSRTAALAQEDPVPWPAIDCAAVTGSLTSDAQVGVGITTVAAWADTAPNDFYYTFTPLGSTPTEGLIIYPGGNVALEAYAPLARAIAAAGYLVALVSAKNYLAIFDNSRADAVIDAYPGIQVWSIGGHSLGGVCAGFYATGSFTHSAKINGIVFWASYPGNNLLASRDDIKVISISGSQDNLTDATDIQNSVANLPADTWWVEIEGANHTQCGYYDTSPYPVQPGLDHDGVPPDDPPDGIATITREAQQQLMAAYTINFLSSLTPNVPDTLETVPGLANTSWERVTPPGFDSDDNFSIVSATHFQNRLYCLTRNEAEGCELWRSTDDGGWQQVLFMNGATNGMYGNPHINNVWARMVVFHDRLYLGVSSGLQGSVLASTGCEIWRYDGVLWEPVISDRKDIDAQGTITAIAGCSDGDGAYSAEITDAGQTWVADQWAGGVLQITTGDGQYRKFTILGNTADTLTVQQNEKSNNETEYTICDAQSGTNFFPYFIWSVGTVQVGDRYEIGIGTDENGFGEFWNKTITDMIIFNDRLYVSTGLNYEDGGQVWYSADGDTWSVTLPAHSFGNYHSDGKPVSSSITSLSIFNSMLYAGGTGTSGDAGSCARAARLEPTGWQLIVDSSIDANDTGSNENGFFLTEGCGTDGPGNFMPWSLATFNDFLLVGIMSMGSGARVLYTDTGSDLDDAWRYSAGGDSTIPDGFDGQVDPADGSYFNLAVNLYDGGSHLYAGLVNKFYLNPFTGAAIPPSGQTPLWRSPDGITWQQIVADGLADSETIIFEAFCEFTGDLYLSASKGASAAPTGYGGAKLYRLVEGSGGVCGDGIVDPTEECETDSDCDVGEQCTACSCEPLPPEPYCGDGIISPEIGETCEADADCAAGEQCTACSCVPTLVELSSLDAIPRSRRIIVRWQTAIETFNAGFNVLRAESPEGPYQPANDTLIPAAGSANRGAAYRFIDRQVRFGRTYYYKIEDIDLRGVRSSSDSPVVEAQTGGMLGRLLAWLR